MSVKSGGHDSEEGAETHGPGLREPTALVGDAESQTVLDALATWVVVHDSERRIVWANRSAAAELGFAPDHVGPGCHALGHRGRPCGPCPVARTFETKTSQAETVLSGGRHLRVRAYPLRREDGSVSEVAEVVDDITELDMVQATMRESQEMVQSLAERSPSMIFINSGGRVVYANERCVEGLGYSLRELLDPTFDFWRLVAPESIEVVRDVFERHSRGEDAPPYEYTIVRKDGERLEVLNSTRLIHYRGERAILGIVTDVSELKRVHRRLAESEERYRTLVETCPDGITLTDLSARPIMTNRQAARIHGYDAPDELLAVGDAFALIAPEDRERALDGMRRTFEVGAIRTEYLGLRKDGSRIPIELSASAIRGADGEPYAFIGVTRDVSERKKAEEDRLLLEEQVRHAQKMESLGMLAGGIAHDFNNLLMAIMGNASLAQIALKDGSAAHEYVEQIALAASRASDLTRQLLTFAGKGERDLETIDLSEVIREIGTLLAVNIPTSVDVRMDLEEGAAVHGDAGQLRQVAMNLITNAAEALGQARGSIVVRTKTLEVDRELLRSCLAHGGMEPGRCVSLEVLDTGAGMDAETEARIFDPFFTTKPDGKGLGLATLLSIVHGHRGAVRIQSEVGRGTTFQVLFPASTTSAPTVGSTPAAPFRGQGTVLVVDDEPAVRSVAEGMLRALGFDALVAESGAHAVKLLRAAPDGVVAAIVDLTMPDVSGEETVLALRAVVPSLRVVLSTGFAAREGRADVPGAAFLHKPYSMERLATVLAELLGSGP